MSDLFTEADIIYAYTRRQALEDGYQVSANEGDLAEVTRQHYKFPVFMTRGVFDLIEQAVNNPRWCNDWKGVWHDILWMSRHGSPIDPTTVRFTVIITGVGRRQYHQMIAQCSPMDIDDPQPVITIMLPEDM